MGIVISWFPQGRLSPHSGGYGYEDFITFRYQSGARFLFDRTAALRPERLASCNHLGRWRFFASSRRSPSAEAISPAAEAGTAPDCPQHGVTPDIADRCSALDVVDIRQARQACERHRQLRRRLRDELPDSQRPVARMFYFRRRVLADVQKHTQLQNLRRVHGGRPGARLEKHRSRMGLQQPRAKVTRHRRADGVLSVGSLDRSA